MVVGLEGISATASAVLVESAVVLVPLMTNRPAAVPLWQHCGPSVVAMGGITLLVGSTGPTGAEPIGLHSGMSVVFSLLSAGFFAAHTMRTDEYGDVEPTEQALGQLLVAFVCDALYLAASSDATAGWLEAASLPHLNHLLLAVGWCGVVTCALTTWAQSHAQQAFSTTTAALAYALDPVCAALFATTLLHEEMGTAQMAGGALVVLANLAAALPAPVGVATSSPTAARSEV